MQRGVPLVPNRALELGQLPGSFPAVLAAFLPSTHHPLQSLELFEAVLEMTGVRNHAPIGEGRQTLDAQINSHYRAGILWDHLLLFHLNRHVPVSRLLTHRRREDLHSTTGRQIPPFFEPEPPQAWQHNGLLADHNPTSEPETPHSLLLGLDLGIAQLPFPLPLLLEGTASKEVR